MKNNYEKLNFSLHRRSKDVFAGLSVIPHVPNIVELVKLTGARRLLDYGCGKAAQYREKRIHMEWGGMRPFLYDVGVPAYRIRPTGVFQGIICTDVMEHIATVDVDEVLRDIMSFVDTGKPAFIFFVICCREAKKTYPDGRNVHLTVKDPTWWGERITKAKPKDAPGLRIRTVYTTA